MLTTHSASPHPALDPQLLTLHPPSPECLFNQQATIPATYCRDNPGLSSERSEWRGYRRDNSVIVPSEGAGVLSCRRCGWSTRTAHYAWHPMIYSPFSIHCSLPLFPRRRSPAGGAGALSCRRRLQPEVQVFFLPEVRLLFPLSPLVPFRGLCPPALARGWCVIYSLQVSIIAQGSHKLLLRTLGPTTDRSAIEPHCFSREQGGKKPVFDPHIWQAYPCAASQCPYMASIEPPKGLKIAINQWRGGKRRATS